MAELKCFIDANVLIRLAARDQPDHLSKVEALIEAVDAGQLIIETDSSVVAETIWVLTKTYGRSRAFVAAFLRELFSHPNIRIDNPGPVLDALSLWATVNRLSFVDALGLTIAKAHGHRRVFSFDQGLDRALEGVDRIEELPAS